MVSTHLFSCTFYKIGTEISRYNVTWQEMPDVLES